MIPERKKDSDLYEVRRSDMETEVKAVIYKSRTDASRTVIRSAITGRFVKVRPIQSSVPI